MDINDLNDKYSAHERKVTQQVKDLQNSYKQEEKKKEDIISSQEIELDRLKSKISVFTDKICILESEKKSLKEEFLKHIDLQMHEVQDFKYSSLEN